MGSAQEHTRRHKERTRYANEQLARQRATKGQPADQVGSTREAHDAAHKDRANPRERR
jgi:hypothetical protein